ncbi:AAA family ATPase [Galenea microaerophila]
MSQASLSTANMALKRALYIGVDEDLMESVRVSIMSKYDLEAMPDAPHVLPDDVNIVFIEFAGDAENTLNIINQVLTIGKGLPVYVLVKEKDADFIIHASHQGVQGFIECPDEVFHILSIIHMQDRRRQGKNGIVSAFFSLKGGVGCTALATNLAAKITDMTDKRTVLVDFHMPLGDTALYLNMEENRLYTITDFIYNLNRLDENLVYKSLSQHTSGLFLLSLPRDLAELEMVDGQKVKVMIDVLRQYFDHVLIDCPSDLSDIALSALDESDNIVLVAEPSLSSIRATNSAVNLAQKLGYLKESLKLIINRNTSHHNALIEELIDALEVGSVSRVDNDYQTFNEALVEGVLLEQYRPDSPVNAQLTRIANMLHNGTELPEVREDSQQKTSWFEGLKAIFTRQKKSSSSKRMRLSNSVKSASEHSAVSEMQSDKKVMA